MSKLLVLAALALSLAACQGRVAPAGGPAGPATAAVAQSPTETLKKLLTAADQGDAAAVKQMLSRETRASCEKSAREHQTSVEELVKQGQVLPADGAAANLETRNEQINGAQAHVEARAPKLKAVGMEEGEWVTFYFRQEDGAWKFDGQATLQALSDNMREKLEQTRRRLEAARKDMQQQRKRLDQAGQDLERAKQESEKRR